MLHDQPSLQPLTMVLILASDKIQMKKITIFLLFNGQWNACLAHPRKTKSELGVGLANVSIILKLLHLYVVRTSVIPASRRQRFKASLNYLKADPALPRRLYYLPEVRIHRLAAECLRMRETPQAAFPPAHRIQSKAKSCGPVLTHRMMPLLSAPPNQKTCPS